MLRDSRIVHIIDLLGELRELLLGIDQAGDTAPAILLKLAKEKAEEITRSTRELRQPEFWDGILRYDPFTSVKTTTHEDAIPSMEKQSTRLDVISYSMTTSSRPSALIALSPTTASSGKM